MITGPNLLTEINQEQNQGQNLCQNQRVDPEVNLLLIEGDHEAGRDQTAEGEDPEAAGDPEVEAEVDAIQPQGSDLGLPEDPLTMLMATGYMLQVYLGLFFFSVTFTPQQNSLYFLRH